MEEHHLKMAVFSFVIIGQWNYVMPNRVLQYLYNAFRVTGVCSALYMWLAFLTNILLNFRNEDLKYLADCFALSLLATLGIIKMILVYSKASIKLIKTVQKTEQNILTHSNTRIKTIFEKMSAQNNRMSVFMIIGYPISVMVYAVQSFINEATNPIPRAIYLNNETIFQRKVMHATEMWVPYDRDVNYMTYTLHCISIGFFLTNSVAASNNMLIGLINFAVGQLKCVQDEFRNITNFDKTGLTQREIDSQIAENVRKAAIYHQNIISFVEDINNLITTLLLIDSLSSVLQIAIVMYYLSAGEEIEEGVAPYVTHLMMLLYLLFLYNWYGNELSLESLNVSDACFESEWRICNTNVKRMLLIVMIRSSRPLQLFAGPLFPMSMTTMLKILKSSYTYCAALREFTTEV